MYYAPKYHFELKRTILLLNAYERNAYEKQLQFCDGSAVPYSISRIQSKRKEKIPMLTLYITRHGETVWNTQKIMQGWSESDLTEKGIQNAIALRNRLKDIPFQAIYASPSKRALQTAEILVQNRKSPSIRIDEKIREIHLGEWEGKTQAYVKEHYPAEFYHFWNAPSLYTSNGGESFMEFQKRVLLFLNKIKEQHKEGNVLLVTHTVVVKWLLAFFKGASLENLWNPPFINGTSLTVIEINREGITIMLEGDVSHQ